MMAHGPGCVDEVFGRASLARAGYARPGQNAVHSLTAQVDALPFPEQLGEMGVRAIA